MPVTCTVTNTRTSAVLILQKTWVDGAAGDTADLSVDRYGPGRGSATSTATGAAGSETDTDNQADATVFSGETVSWRGAGRGQHRYLRLPDRVQPAGADARRDGRGGTFAVPAAPVPVTCTITNTRTSATITLQKEWVNGATDDTADCR